jgi:hypothetical protein
MLFVPISYDAIDRLHYHNQQWLWNDIPFIKYVYTGLLMYIAHWCEYVSIKDFFLILDICQSRQYFDDNDNNRMQYFYHMFRNDHLSVYIFKVRIWLYDKNQ